MIFSNTTIKELHQALKAGTVTSKELYDASISAIKERDESIHAFIEVFDDQDTSVAVGDQILSGIPFAVKDNILFKGKKASVASKILENYVASYDSKIAEILKEQGAILIGRANMDDSAMGTSTESSYYGITRNPIDETRVPGGSSGGPAAAVAAGMVMYALGSDTGGSIRQPAACCGVVGLKPTYGSVSRRGLIALASSLDVIGPITHSVEDAETVFNVIHEYDELDNTSVPLDVRKTYQEKNVNNKVIGVPRSFLEVEGIHPDVLKNFNKSLEKMKQKGYSIVDVELPNIKHALAVYYIIQPAEASSNLARYDGIRYGLSEKGEDLIDGYKKTKTAGFGREVQRRIMLGTYVLSSGYHDEYYYKARQLRAKITEEIREVFETIDILATPTAPNVAFKFGEKKDPISLYLEDIFTVPYNLTGNPAISIPSGTNREGMPFGMHFTAPMFCENKLFAVGKDFENAILE
ncbi:Asp-tRNA(Asn)/Glu-tRNA(Gln) amidotransferase subunit GatA [Patescibacteria group bacterium]|nr:Asp-tRNA(Asn)/Glu-tRNA(Gln) amidotransferase subunit GatA [Patescibacteria group bacterium]